MKLLIRQYRPADKDPVLALFRIGILEHIGPCFQNAMTSPLYLTITLALCAAGYLFGSVLGAVVLPGAWVGLVYYCCHETSASSARLRARPEIQDIPGHYLSRPGNCFWVLEAEVDGRAQIVGMVAVMAKQSGKERYGELGTLTVSPSCRRVGLGSRLTQTAIDFCKDQGFSKVVLISSSTRTASLALYKKLGFRTVLIYTKKTCPFWVVKLARVRNIIMEKQLKT